MICSIEIELLKAIDYEAVYRKIALKSSEMERFLFYFFFIFLVINGSEIWTYFEICCILCKLLFLML